LLTKGAATEDRARDHVFYFIEVDGQSYRATKISHSAHGQIDDHLLGAIARQMRLRSKELDSFVACTTSREQWLVLWRQRGTGHWYS